METPTPNTFFANLEAFETDQISRAREGLKQFTAHPTDVIISTSGKSGTTWMQQICHGLRSGGDMSFDEIDVAVLYMDEAHEFFYDLNAPQSHAPRMFKTHRWYPDCPKGAGKYIVVVRQPTDVMVSFFPFLKSWFGGNDEPSLDAFIQHKCSAALSIDHPKNYSQLHHIMSWYPHRFDKNVLWLHYEDLKENLRECVRLIADFLDIGSGNDELQELVTHQASFEFMMKHQSKFDEHALRLSMAKKRGIAEYTISGPVVPKVRFGESGRGNKILSDNAIRLMDECWKTIITSETGHVDYDAFRVAINKELNRSFLQ